MLRFGFSLLLGRFSRLVDLGVGSVRCVTVTVALVARFVTRVRRVFGRGVAVVRFSVCVVVVVVAIVVVVVVVVDTFFATVVLDARVRLVGCVFHVVMVVRSFDFVLPLLAVG